MGARCLDCRIRDMDAGMDLTTPNRVCEHWKPEFWENRGFERGWGDAAVYNWPQFEVLRSETSADGQTRVEFVILAPADLRRPLVITASYPTGQGHAWGSY